VIAADGGEFERIGVVLRGRFDISESAEQRTVSVAAPEEAETLAQVAAVVAQAGIEVDEVALRRPTLDDAFLRADRRHGRGAAGDRPVGSNRTLAA
jgi:ABC-2 type transport system ATP-binding protein